MPSVVTDSGVSFRVQVDDIRLDVSIPVNSVIGAMVFLCEGGELFIALYTNGRRSVLALTRILSSDKSA